MMADFMLPDDLAATHEIAERKPAGDGASEWLNEYHARDIADGELLIVTDDGYVVARRKAD